MRTADRYQPGRWTLAMALLATSACHTSQRSWRPEKPAVMAPTQRLLGAAWDDPLRCQSAVAAGARMPKAHLRVRLVQWTLDHFPEAKGGSNAEWLGCALSYLDADIIVLTGLLLNRDGVLALDEVAAILSKNAGASWRMVADACTDSNRHRVVILVRESTIKLSAVASDPTIDTSPHRNPQATECMGSLLPALGAYVQSTRGGLDFHLLATELADGMTPTAFESRAAAWPLFAQVAKHRQVLRVDPDVVIAATLNTVGKRGESYRTAMAEREDLAHVFSAAEPALKLLEPLDTCTEYVHGEPRQVSYIAVAAGMEEVQGIAPKVSSVCGALHCQNVNPAPYLMLEQVSNHCPLVFDLLDQDQD